jgi:hypothetical protein
VGRYVTPDVPLRSAAPALGRRDAVTIGEALEASALLAGDKTVDQSDAAAIQAAEVRATGTNEVTPGGVASMAQSAADVNPRIMLDEAKTRLSDVLSVIFFFNIFFHYEISRSIAPKSKHAYHY